MAAVVQPARAQILDLPLDLSLLDIDGTLEQTLESLTPAVSAITGCSPAECTNILTALAGQTAQSQQAVASALSSATLQSSQQLSDFALSTTVYEGAIAGFQLRSDDAQPDADGRNLGYLRRRLHGA